MICNGRGNGMHGGCRGHTTCDRQHRAGSVNVDVFKVPKKTVDDEENKE